MDTIRTLITFERGVYLEAKRRALLQKTRLSTEVNEVLKSYYGIPLEIKYDRAKAARASSGGKQKKEAKP
jgi:hypothetical protein